MGPCRLAGPKPQGPRQALHVSGPIILRDPDDDAVGARQQCSCFKHNRRGRVALKDQAILPRGCGGKEHSVCGAVDQYETAIDEKVAH